MKKLFTLVFAMMAAISINADDVLYLVGDGTPIGWEGDVNQRQSTRMRETSPGVYVWTGLLKHGNEGFKIQEGTSPWDVRYCPSSENFSISQEGGTDTYQSANDWKWNPSDEQWKWYTITVDKNNGTLSWQAASPTLLVADGEGYFNIGTPEELNTLALMCRNNPNNENYKVRLTADIDYTAYKNGSLDAIGITELYAPFRGEFDGQNHTVTVDLESYSTRFGFFGTIQGKVHNLKLAGKITATNKNQIGSFCGLLKGNDNKIYNCISTVEIVDAQSGDGTIGGFCAVTYDATTIENCAFYGKINAPGRDGNGGFVGWCNSGASTTIKNCLIVAEISWNGGGDFGRNNPSVINSFKVDASDADLANGQMTYKLNGYVSGSENWFQTLGTDAMPTPLSTSQKIYANGTFFCDGVTSKGGDIVLSNTDVAVVDPHTFGEDGVCSVCKAAGAEATEVDGVFQLNNAGNLLWWAAYVNAGNPTSNAVLTADVDMSAAKYVPAGTSEYKYVGTFDGQGHKVNLKLENPGLNYQGLFGVATDGATIKNVVVTGVIKGNSYVAGIVGGSNGSEDGKTLSLINCGNEAEITAANANGAGLIGVNMSGAAHFYMLNCYNTGNVTSARESGAITGWSGGDKSVFTNVYNIGTITNGEGDGFMRGGGTLKNTYNLSASDAQIASGELCFKLNGDQSTIAWYQKLDEDAHPMPFVKEGAQVYVNGTYSCPNKYEAGEGYTNAEPVIPAHQYAENGLCSVCDGANPDFLALIDGAYEIDDLIKLNWFAHFVNDGNVEANAKLTADIAMEEDNQYGYTPIGSTANPYVGHFNGQGHSVTLRINNPGFDYQGLFGVVTDGARIEKVVVKGFVTGKAYVGGIAGGTNGGSSNAKQTNIWYCGNEATITANGNNGAGIIGVNMKGSASIIVTSCYNTGNVTSANEGGAISGWLGGGWSSVRNCYNSGIIKNGENASKAFGRNDGCYFTNCYYTETSGTDNTSENTSNGTPAMVADATLASGELAYKLIDGFYQTIGTDAYPTTEFTKPSVSYVGDAGYATMYDTTTGYTLNGDIKAYAAVLKGEWIALTEVENVPESTPVVLKGTYYNKVAADLPAINVANSLVGADADVAADGTMFILANGADGVGFYKAEGTIPAGKAYIVSSSSVKAFFFEADDATGINEVNGQWSMINGQSIYNVAGQRVSKMQKGINIVNGKKVLF